VAESPPGRRQKSVVNGRCFCWACLLSRHQTRADAIGTGIPGGYYNERDAARAGRSLCCGCACVCVICKRACLMAFWLENGRVRKKALTRIQWSKVSRPQNSRTLTQIGRLAADVQDWPSAVSNITLAAAGVSTLESLEIRAVRCSGHSEPGGGPHGGRRRADEMLQFLLLALGVSLLLQTGSWTVR